jgi:hypothetical protein
MARAVCPNPECQTVSPVPDTFLGRKVTCKKCKTAFVVTATVEITVDARPITSELLTVVARRVGAKNGAAKETMLADAAPAKSSAMTPLWAATLMAAVVVLVLPVSGAGLFVAFHNWGKNRTPNAARVNETGEMYGGIEIASSGVKATVIELYPSQKYEYDYRTIFKKSRDTKVVTGLDKNDQFDADALGDTINTVQSYFERLTKEYRLAPEKIQIVGGSGLFKAIRDRKDRSEDVKAELIHNNQAVLTEKVAKATGKQMEFIDVRQEVKLMITGLVRERETARAMLIDVGSSATRGGYRDQAGGFVTFEGPGVALFESRLRASGAKPHDYPAVARNLAEKELHEPLRKELEHERKAGLKNRDIVYLNGGAVWVLATFTHPQERDIFVPLKAQDIKDFHALVCSNPEAFPVLRLPDGMDAKTNEDVQTEVADMKDRFKPQRLLAGAEVLKAIAEEFHFENKELYFTRDGGDVGWLLADIIEKRTAKR